MLQFSAQPRPGQTPVAAHGGNGDTQHLGYLFVSESSKEAILDHGSLPFAQRFQAVECLVEIEQLVGPSFPRDQIIVKCGRYQVAASLQRAALMRVVD